MSRDILGAPRMIRTRGVLDDNGRVGQAVPREQRVARDVVVAVAEKRLIASHQAGKRSLPVWYSGWSEIVCGS